MKNMIIGIVVGVILTGVGFCVYKAVTFSMQERAYEQAQRDNKIASLPQKWQDLIWAFRHSDSQNSVLVCSVPVDAKNELMKYPLTDEQAHFISRLGTTKDEGDCYIQLMPYIKKVEVVYQYRQK